MLWNLCLMLWRYILLNHSNLSHSFGWIFQNIPFLATWDDAHWKLLLPNTVLIHSIRFDLLGVFTQWRASELNELVQYSAAWKPACWFQISGGEAAGQIYNTKAKQTKRKRQIASIYVSHVHRVIRKSNHEVLLPGSGSPVLDYLNVNRMVVRVLWIVKAIPLLTPFRSHVLCGCAGQAVDHVFGLIYIVWHVHLVCNYSKLPQFYLLSCCLLKRS